MWAEDKIRMFWVDVGEYPEADRLLNISPTETTCIAFNSIEDTYSELPASFSPSNLDMWITDLKDGKAVNLHDKPKGELILLDGIF
jgi:hypothetical protein